VAETNFTDLRDIVRELAQARRLLGPALHAMMAAVHRYEGTVNQVLGDGLMALFGAPIAHEDHAVRACFASASETFRRPFLCSNGAWRSARAATSRCTSRGSPPPWGPGRGYQAHALRLLGDIAMHRESRDIEQAAAHYHQALTLAEEIGMRPLQAHCHHGLGTLYATAGRREQAQAKLSAAMALYRAMDMTFWLPQVETAMARTSTMSS
jgi:tetratricopeptide (TPR) repeat protein